MGIFSSLKRDQKEAIGLLQIGTFLEYFDLMLYVHMAVLLNDLFFPKTDPHTSSLISAFAFCSTWILRPFGALIFGYIGDHIGRKTTVIITTMMMAVSCIVMANLPTYAQIGISAAWIVTSCRIVQGLSSMGEVIGAMVYLTEMTKPPKSYPIVALLDTASSFGGMMALLMASFVTLPGIDWRIGFWVGASIAIIGTVARTRLRETLDFVDMKRRMKKAIEESSSDGLGNAAALLKSTNSFWKEKTKLGIIINYFLMSCASPLCFYVTYIYCGELLKRSFGYTAEEVIHQNLIISIFGFLSITTTAFLSYKVRPLLILKIKTMILFPFILITPYLLYSKSPYAIMLVQFMFIVFALAINPSYPILLKYVPILKRFTSASLIYAISRALTYIITTFGCVYLTEWFGFNGLLLIMVPISIGFYSGVYYFEKLEQQSGAILKPQAVMQPASNPA